MTDDDPDPDPDQAPGADGGDESPDGQAPDGAQGGGPGDAVGLTAALRSPRLRDWPCPTGWAPSMVEEGQPWEFSACAPPARAPCGPGEYQPIDSEQCVRLGEACPADGVRDWDRTSARPAGYRGEVKMVANDDELAVALAVATPGDLISLAVGDYVGPLDLTGVAVVGACPAGVRILSPSDGPGVQLRNGALIKGITLLGGSPVVLGTDAGIAVEEVEIAGGQDAGIRLNRAAGALRHVVVRGLGAELHTFAVGIELLSGGHIAMHDVVVEGFGGFGYLIDVNRGGSVQGSNCVAAEIGGSVDSVGVGMSFAGNGDLDLRRTLFEGIHGQGILAGAETRSHLQDMVIR